MFLTPVVPKCTHDTGSTWWRAPVSPAGSCESAMKRYSSGGGDGSLSEDVSMYYWDEQFPLEEPTCITGLSTPRDRTEVTCLKLYEPKNIENNRKHD